MKTDANKVASLVVTTSGTAQNGSAARSVLPGIMPIVDCRKIVEFAGFCITTVPKDILDRMEPVLDLPEDVRKLGVEFAVKQCDDLQRHGVNYFHFYAMNRSDSVSEILDALGMRGCEGTPGRGIPRLSGNPRTGGVRMILIYPFIPLSSAKTIEGLTKRSALFLAMRGTYVC